MAKFPYLSGRAGSSSLYYKRMVALELRGEGRPAQIWRSLRTSDRKKAESAYAALHAEIEALFEAWRKDDALPPASPSLHSSGKSDLQTVALTPALLRRLVDARYLNAYDDDFRRRGELWKKVHTDEEAFWRGEIIKLVARYDAKVRAPRRCLVKLSSARDTWI